MTAPPYDPACRRRPPGGVRGAVARRRLRLLQLGPQVLPRGLPGDAGHAQREPHPDRVPRQHRGDGAGQPDGRRRGRRLRPLHPVRRLRAALPEHPVHRRLLPAPDPDREASSRRCGRWPCNPGVEQPDWKRWVEATLDAKSEPVLDVPVAQENVARLGRGLGPADRRRDDPVRRLRGRLLPDQRRPARRPSCCRPPASSSG